MHSDINNSNESIIYLLQQLDGQNVPITQNVPIEPRIVRRRIDSKSIDKQTICSEIIDTLQKIKDYQCRITNKRRKIYSSALEIEKLCANYKKLSRQLRAFRKNSKEGAMNDQNIIDNIAKQILEESGKALPQYNIPNVNLSELRTYNTEKLNNIRESLNQILFSLGHYHAYIYDKAKGYEDATRQIKVINAQAQRQVATLKQKQRKTIEKIKNKVSEQQQKKIHYISLIPTTRKQNEQKKPSQQLNRKQYSNQLIKKSKPLTTRNVKLKKQILSGVPKKTVDVYKKTTTLS